MSSITFIISAVLTVFVLHSFDEPNIAAAEGDMTVNIQSENSVNITKNSDLIQPLGGDFYSLDTGLLDEAKSTASNVSTLSVKEAETLHTSSI